MWIGNGAQMLVRRALAGNHIDAEGVDEVEAEHALEIFMAAYDGGHEHTVVYPGVRESLKWLQKQGVEMALITNKPERFVAPLLDELKLGRFFRWIIGGDTLPQKKPDPAALFFVMKMAGNTPPSRCLSAIRAMMCWRPRRRGCKLCGLKLRLQPWSADCRRVAGAGD
jgi:phosphoglycolate phosphatase